MKKRNFRIMKLTLLVTALALGASANAEVLQYKFSDTGGIEKSVSPSLGYINPKNSFKVSVSAGIDRKVKVSILRTDGTVVSTIKSKLIGSADRITIDGKDYYGAELTITKPADGAYKLLAETLSTSDATVSSETLPLNVDSTIPTLGEWKWEIPYGKGIAPDGNPIFSPVEARFLSLDTQDAGELSKATFQTFEHLDDGTINQVREGVITIDVDNRRLMLGTGSMSSLNNTMIPTGVQGRYSIKFNAEDKAGNKVSKTLDFWNNSKCSVAPEAVAIYDKSYTGDGYMGVPGFRSLIGQSSTPITENPATVMFKLPSREVRATPEGAIYGGEPGGVREYNIISNIAGVTHFTAKENIVETGLMNWNQIGWTNFSTFRCNPLQVKNPVFSDAALPPVWVGISPYIEGYGWLKETINTKGGAYPRDLFISKIKPTVEPRSYNQVANFGIGQCVIPAGADHCILEKNFPFNKTGTTGHYHNRPSVYKEQDSLVRIYSTRSLLWEWDAADPVIEKLDSHDTSTKVVVFTASKINAGGTWGRVNIGSGGLVAKNSAGNSIKLNSSKMETVGTITNFTTSYQTIKSGLWEIYGWAEDLNKNYSEKLLFTIDNDGDAPTIRFEKTSEIIASLDRIKIIVEDDKTLKPKIKTIKLEGGPSKETIYLAASETATNEYKLEYPVIFPSFGTGYKLTVTAQDDSGNASTNTFDFNYDPPTTGLLEEGFSIPSVGKYAWAHTNGKLPFTSMPLTNYEGTPLTGSYELSGTLRADSTSGPISINGVSLKPGETKNIGSFNFTNSKGELSLPVYADQDGTVGVANLLISSGAPGASIVVGSFNVWSPKISVNPAETTLEGRVLLDVFSIGLKDNSGRCEWRPKSEIQSISSVDIITNPACFNTALENGMEFYQGKNYSALYSRLAKVTNTDIPAGMASGAKIRGSYLNAGGGKEQIVIDLPVQAGALKLIARDASDAIKFGDDNTQISIFRSIQSIDQSLVQTSGPSCGSITSNEAEAISTGSKMSPQKGISTVACYFKWISTPPGMVTGDNEQQGFKINGTINDLGIFPISWELVAYTPLGQSVPVTLSKQSMSVEVINPPPPSIEIQSTRAISSDLFTVQKKPTNIGVVNITGLADGAVVYKVSRAGVVIADSSDKSEYAKKLASYRLNSDLQAKLWASQSYTLQASYVKLPEIIATKEITTVTVPDDDMSMKVNTELNKALSSDTIPVTVGFYNKSNVNSTYSVEDAGEWSVRLVDVKSAKNRLPLSSWTPVNSDGTVTIDLPLSLNAGDMMHIGSEGSLSSKLDGFEMSKTSANTITLTVLDASPVEGELKSYKVSGIAPLSVSTSLVTTQKNLVSEVEWQMSDDNGATWKVIEGSPKVPSKMLSNTYEAGIHHVRAKLKNRYSGVLSYTSILQVQAYHVPDARMIDGPTVMLMGQQGEKYVTDKEGKRLQDSDQVVYEWSTDRGATWITKDDKYSFDHTSEVGNFPLWARVRYASSPAEDSYAYKTVKTMVSVRKTAKVTVGLVGTAQPEVNKSNIYTASVNLPYSNMQGEVAGRFKLPDGTTVDGFTLDYRPTEKVTESQLITFEAWIVGYEADSKRSVSKKLRTWEYTWPVFALRQIQDPTSYAPMTLDLRVENVGSLNRIEDLTYSWDLPESDTFITTPGRLDTRRVAKITEPGTYPVSVTVSDSRGNITVLKQDLVIAEAPPWVVDLTWTGSNSNNRATLDIRTKPQITRGHKYDSITSYTYKVNGAVVGSDTRYTNLSLTEPGRYTLSLDLTTELGFGGYGSTIIDVVENQKPECSLNVKQTSTAYVVTSACTDTDGKMASYEWSINGEQQAIKGSAISISKRSYPTQPKIQLVGVDDSGGRSQPVLW